MPRPKTREEKLFSAAVLRRSLALGGEAHRRGFEVIYAGVLRDLRLEASEVDEYLASHGAEVEAALGRAPKRRG